MERIIKSVFGLKFWINNPKKQKEVEHEAVRRNLVRFSNCATEKLYLSQDSENIDLIRKVDALL